jgi:hypothetical protein
MSTIPQTGSDVPVVTKQPEITKTCLSAIVLVALLALGCKAALDTSKCSSGNQERHDVFTRAVLNSLDFDTIPDLAPHLSLAHLTFFEEKYLTDEKFPWAIFMAKAGFGHSIAYIHSNYMIA